MNSTDVMEAMNNVSKEIRKALIDKDWSQRDLFLALRSEGLKVSETMISNRLNGITTFSEKEIKAINKILHLGLKGA
jgi:ribosome-binding protein aMBF1 (putative translation factor)